MQSCKADKRTEADAKKKAKKQEVVRKIFKRCSNCEELTDNFASGKKNCKPCNRDYEAALADAKRQNELKFFQEICKDPAELRNYLEQFKEECGEATGSGNKRGGFNIAKYKQMYYARKGIRNEREQLLLTQKQFTTLMEAKGKSATWATAEWDRRKAAPDSVWKKGVDPDTKLPTIAAYGNDKEIDFDEKGIDDVVELEGKAMKNPKKKDVDSLLANLGEDGLDNEAACNLLRANNFVDAAIDFRAGTETKNFKPSEWTKRKEENAECTDTEIEDGAGGDDFQRGWQHQK